MKYAIIHCNLLDGTKEMELQPDRCILIEEGRITAIQSAADVIPAGYTTIDMGGKYVLPGLINLHAHLFGSGKPSKVLGAGGLQSLVIRFCGTCLGKKVMRGIIRGNLKNALNAGITTLRSVGDFYYCDVDVRNEILAGKFEGPRLFVSGPAITVTNGHGDGNFAVTANGPWPLRALVRKNVRNGVDFIKICVTGGVMDSRKKGEAGALRMTVEEAKAICEEAHKNGFLVASHTESSAGVKVDLLAGVDTIEHGGKLDDEMVELMKKNGTAVICTISPALPLALLSPKLTKLSDVAQYNSRIIMDGIIQCAKTALANHIPVGLGTDAACSFVTQYDMWRELVYFQHYTGVSNAFAIYSATLQNAAIFRIDKETGSLEVGKSADLIAVSENPLEDLSALQNVRMVMHEGKLIEHPIVSRNSMIDQYLDQLATEIRSQS